MIAKGQSVYWKNKNKYFSDIITIFTDGGYRGELIERVHLRFGWVLEKVKRNEVGQFQIFPKQWIVERTFAWIFFQKRVSKDYERQAESSIAFFQLSIIRVMLNKF